MIFAPALFFPLNKHSNRTQFLPMTDTSKSADLFARALKVIPGGVNSPVRAFRAVGGNPLFIKSARGAYLKDEDGNKYIDLINSWGPMLLGHANPMIEHAVTEAVKSSLSFGAPGRREVEIAELICEMVPSAEKVRMVNSGTEATMAAIRVARGFTGREKIIKFEGCYHGHGDSFLIAAGSGAATLGVPDSPGVTQGVANDTLTAPYNNLQAVQELIDANPGKIAALIIEPVAGNMGLVLPEPGFLEGLREMCTANGIVYIFDEVMTGFRLAKGGAQELFGVTPDMTTLGKIIGGGMPVGAYCGRADIMNTVSPLGPVYQAGTLSGNPVAMAAGMAMLHELNDYSQIYNRLDECGARLEAGLKADFAAAGLSFTINRVGSMFTIFFKEGPVRNFDEAKGSDLPAFGRWFRSMLNAGVYCAPSQFESLFISASIGDDEVNHILQANRDALVNLYPA